MVKKYVLLLVLVCLVLTSCCSLKEKKAELLLEDKYGEDFVTAYDDFQEFDGEYTVVAKPKSNPNIIFSADVKGKEINDTYIGRQAERKITKKIKKKLDIDDSYVFTQLMVQHLPKGYQKLKKVCEYPGNSVSVYICVKKGVKKKRILGKCKKAIKKMPYLTGRIYIYSVPKDTIPQIKDYVEKRPRIYSDFKEEFGKYEKCSYGFAGGVVSKYY